MVLPAEYLDAEGGCVHRRELARGSARRRPLADRGRYHRVERELGEVIVAGAGGLLRGGSRRATKGGVQRQRDGAVVDDGDRTQNFGVEAAGRRMRVRIVGREHHGCGVRGRNAALQADRGSRGIRTEQEDAVDRRAGNCIAFDLEDGRATLGRLGADAVAAVDGVGHRHGVVGDDGGEVRAGACIGRADEDAVGAGAGVGDDVAVDLDVLRGPGAAHQRLNGVVEAGGRHANGVVQDLGRETAAGGAALERRDRDRDARGVAAERIVGEFGGDVGVVGASDQDAVVVVRERVGVPAGADGVDGQVRLRRSDALETGGLVAGEDRVLQVG